MRSAECSHGPKRSEGASLIHTVGIAQMLISGDQGDQLITHALGSCLGIAMYDHSARVGGLLHAMLPSGAMDPAKATANPCMFVDTGLPLLLDYCLRRGASQQRLIIKAAGGASSHPDERDDYFQIGKRNIIMLRKVLWGWGLILLHHDIGGFSSRTVTLHICDGQFSIKCNGATRML
jgi:chemotaxis protein CheD